MVREGAYWREVHERALLEKGTNVHYDGTHQKGVRCVSVQHETWGLSSGMLAKRSGGRKKNLRADAERLCGG